LSNYCKGCLVAAQKIRCESKTFLSGLIRIPGSGRRGQGFMEVVGSQAPTGAQGWKGFFYQRL
jgi:hypothetical protein